MFDATEWEMWSAVCRLRDWYECGPNPTRRTLREVLGDRAPVWIDRCCLTDIDT